MSCNINERHRKKMKHRFDKKKILWIIFALTLLFIWWQSSLPRSASTVESRSLTFFLFGKGSFERIVRKYAHFIEYSVLGAELGAIISRAIRSHLKKENSRWYHILLPSVNLGLIIAFIDETIQYFSKRSPEVRDIWIDLLGVTAGTLAFCLLSKGGKRFR